LIGINIQPRPTGRGDRRNANTYFVDNNGRNYKDLSSSYDDLSFGKNYGISYVISARFQYEFSVSGFMEDLYNYLVEIKVFRE